MEVKRPIVPDNGGNPAGNSNPRSPAAGPGAKPHRSNSLQHIQNQHQNRRAFPHDTQGVGSSRISASILPDINTLEHPYQQHTEADGTKQIAYNDNQKFKRHSLLP
ncbi:hypothetical protein D3C87_1762060 [compost metagenome]